MIVVSRQLLFSIQISLTGCFSFVQDPPDISATPGYIEFGVAHQEVMVPRLGEPDFGDSAFLLRFRVV